MTFLQTSHKNNHLFREFSELFTFLDCLQSRPANNYTKFFRVFYLVVVVVVVVVVVRTASWREGYSRFGILEADAGSGPAKR